jgi:hypothetical protein
MDAMGVKDGDLADFMGVAPQTVNRYRAGGREPRGHIAAWLPVLLRTSPWWLFGWPPGFKVGQTGAPPVPIGTGLFEALREHSGAILALQPTASRAEEALGVAALAQEVSAMIHRALAKALETTLAKDEATRTRAGRIALADILERFADDLHDNGGVDVHDITKAVRALRKGLLT